MKRILTLALVFGYAVATAQKADNVGIGTTKPDPSAILDLNTTNKGFLMPRMTETERNAIKNPAMALKVYQIDGEKGEYTFDGITWQPSARVGATNSVGAWDKQGNAVDGTDFLGTTNNFPLVFKVNGQNSGRIDISSQNTMFGYFSGNTNTGIANTFLGFRSGGNGSGNYNVSFGSESLQANTAGTHNSALGTNTLYSNTTGKNIVAIGSNSLFNNNGDANVGIGSYTLFSNVSGINNVAIGTNSLVNNAGSYNEGIGTNSLMSNTTGSNNFGLGASALTANTVGEFNVGVGNYSLYRNISGHRNTALGTNAGYSNVSGVKSIFIGSEAGYNETGSEKLYIANSNTSTPLIGGDFLNSTLKFHTGSAVPSASAGFVAIGDFSTPNGSTPGSGGINSFPAFTGSSKYRLIVQDGILTEKLKVALRNGAEWADYVFDPEYKLMTLEEVEQFTLQNNHLPNVPSADEMVKNGLDITKTSAKLMEKIEELTLYMIQLNKDIRSLKAENMQLRESLKK